jgi:hypothetical protein
MALCHLGHNQPEPSGPNEAVIAVGRMYNQWSSFDAVEGFPPSEAVDQPSLPTLLGGSHSSTSARASEVRDRATSCRHVYSPR